MKKIFLLFSAVCLAIGANAQTWNQIPTGTTKNLNAIDFPTADVGYIVGDSSLILTTTNGGQTWTEVAIVSIPWNASYSIVDVDFVSQTTGYISVEYGGTFKTVDGGINWTEFGNLSFNMCYSQTVYIDNPDHLFIGGAGCFQGSMIEEYDAGTWNPVLTEPFFWNATQHVNEISFGDAMIGLASVRNEYIVRTADGGATWDSIRIDLLGVGAYLTSVKMVDNLLAYAGYNDNGNGLGILKTTDGGLTWTQDFNSATFYYPSYNCVHIAANGDVYSGTRPSSGPNGVIFESTDGINWTYESVGQSINGMNSYGSDVTFAVGDSGYLVVNTLPSTLTIDKLSYDVLSVYPNPVKDVLSVRVAIVNENDLQIFTAMGAQVEVTFTKLGDLTSIDVSSLSKGVYVLKVNDSKSTRSVRFVKN
jgi:photosystem II stability/assembly factor-like uncharacterized protein